MEFPDLASAIRTDPPRNGAFYLVAVDGRGGAGKSTLATALLDSLPGFALIAGDDYFEPMDDPIGWGGFNEERFAVDVSGPWSAGHRALLQYGLPLAWDATI
jgi:hypothetical protein